jgi:hypothetical protein
VTDTFRDYFPHRSDFLIAKFEVDFIYRGKRDEFCGTIVEKKEKEGIMKISNLDFIILLVVLRIREIPIQTAHSQFLWIPQGKRESMENLG